jgi:hypothetical protein
MDATNTKPNWNRGRNPRNNQILRRQLPAYGMVGVKYVVTDPGEELSTLMYPVYHSNVMRIYELPKFTPYFNGRDCSVHATSREEVEVRCLKPTTVVRLESFTPYWKASINGQPTEVRMYDGLFQSVEVPAGMSTVRFTYECPHGGWTVPMFWLGALGFVAVGAGEFWARREVPAHRTAKTDPKMPLGAG